MNSYDEGVKKLQAESLRQLEMEMAAARAEAAAQSKRDPLRAERNLFLRGLIEARLQRKLTQADLAKRAGLTQPALARIESGKGNPGLKTLLAICKAIDVDLMVK